MITTYNYQVAVFLVYITLGYVSFTAIYECGKINIRKFMRLEKIPQTLLFRDIWNNYLRYRDKCNK